MSSSSYIVSRYMNYELKAQMNNFSLITVKSNWEIFSADKGLKTEKIVMNINYIAI